ncbi:hypothetical protein BDR07DRAFT_1397495, partial [Suillus spraguei]
MVLRPCPTLSWCVIFICWYEALSLFPSTIWALVVAFSLYMRSFRGSAHNLISRGSRTTLCLLFSDSSCSPHRHTLCCTSIYWSNLPVFFPRACSPKSRDICLSRRIDLFLPDLTTCRNQRTMKIPVLAGYPYLPLPIQV